MPSYGKRQRIITTKELVPNAYNVDISLDSGECDRLSALLTDYLAFAHTHCLALEHSKCIAAQELTAQWMSQAADLRDKIEARD